MTATEIKTAQVGARRGVGTVLLDLLRRRETSILAAFLLMTIVTAMVNPEFVFSADGWRNLLLNPAIYLVLAIGEGIVIITKNVDLSVGSVMGLTAFMIGSVYIAWPGMPAVVAFVIGVAFGAGLGLVNGGLVAVAKVPGMVITLGTMYIFRGINILWAGSSRINASQLGADFLAFGNARWLGIPALTILAVVVLLIAAWYLRSTRSGREYYAIGSAPEAAELYGLPTRRRMLVAFVISGAMAGLAGTMFAARYGTIASNAGTGYEMQAIGAAVIGGIAIVGGSGTLVGAAFGAFLLATINSALPVLGIQSFWQRAVVGALIIGAIILDRVLAERQRRRLIAERMAS
ncbi:MAG: ABC transporter permease [Propionicimonas sp.]|uniref:ABC transporter permease n=1 Tax=Propionicimonas sp. TaxID=1955623 RepID=UPI002B21E66E|nr:ABC transporter permease [Propionicimonas sp.]MEA4945072.1 ABC transporter permease [Propionicimonas sp.]MEA5053047.1 ABC transporter permease [Propionicimonas sp.]MEA5118577.1 ABC transporter permease [Propionicimonas sp.]